MIDALGSIVSGVGRANAAVPIRDPAPAQSASAISGPSFGDVMADVAAGAVGTMRQAEAASISGIQGKASVQQVVEAVMSAEQTLQTAIAVRDKVVAAYQEISRMAI